MLLVLVGNACRAQLQPWQHFDGSSMSNTNIVEMTVDKNGLLYLGTHGGVDIFDGRKFHFVEIPNAVSLGINPFVNDLRWGKNGLLWVSTRTHIYTYNPADGKVRLLFGNGSLPLVGRIDVDTIGNKFYFIDEDSLAIAPLCDTAIKVQKKLLAGAVIKSRLSAKGELFLFSDYNKVLKLINGRLNKIYEAPGLIDMDYSRSTDQVVLLGEKELVAINCETGVADTLPQKCTWPYQVSKTRFATLPSGRLLIQHAYGMDVYASLRDTAPIRFRAVEGNPHSLNSDFVLRTFEDPKGNIWISEDGINFSVLPLRRSAMNYISEKMTGATRLWASYHDAKRQQVFTGSEFGICRFRYKGDTPGFTKAIKPRGMRFFEPLAFRKWGEDEVLVLTNGQEHWILNTKSLSLRPFDTLNRRKGKLNYYGALPVSGSKLVFFGQAGLCIYDRATRKFTEAGKTAEGEDIIRKSGVMSAMVDRDALIWVADANSLQVLDTGLRLVKKYTAKSDKNPDGLSNTVIMDMKQTQSGHIYLATMGGGVLRLGADDHFRPVPLVGDITSVFCLAETSPGELLITSGKGMICYDEKTGRSCVLSEQYGMPVSDFNQLALSWDDSMLVAAGTKGYVVVPKSGLKPLFADTAHVALMQGAVVLRELVLPKGNENVDLEVAIPGYLAGANWKLRYQLEGIDNKWRELASGEWEIRYNSIKPGRYTLRVEAYDANNVIYAFPASLEIVALPYFWQTAWFQLLIAGVFLAVLIAVVRFLSQMQLRWKLKKLEDEQKIARERVRISRELHDNVGSQLTYLISGLESSNLLLKKKDNERLEQKLDKMRSSARESMQQLRDSIWALNNESVQTSVLFSRFRQWMEQMMEAAPDMHYRISGNITDDITLDPLRSLNLFRVMQEAIHNVLKHSGANNVTVVYDCRGGSVTVTIEDDGKGFAKGEKVGNGQKTMAARATEAGGHLEVNSAPGKGTRVTVSIGAATY
ncbi:MAG: hypothetical protein KF744_15100 [Taibaiella sp.]|nr:hypothetical protein [Taibaiella sp.]